MNPEEIPKPTEIFITKGFFETAKGKTLLATILGIIISVILMITLNYYEVIFLPLSFLPEKLAIPCPIQGQTCNKSDTKVVNFNQKIAIALKVTPATKIVNPVQVVDSRQFILPPYTKNDPIGLNQSFIMGNICYTLTYTVPNDSNISRVQLLPLKSGAQLITLGSEIIKLGKDNLNVLLQLQKRPLGSGTTDQQKCPVYNVDPSKYGQYQNPTSVIKP